MKTAMKKAAPQTASAMKKTAASKKTVATAGKKAATTTAKKSAAAKLDLTALFDYVQDQHFTEAHDGGFAFPQPKNEALEKQLKTNKPSVLFGHTQLTDAEGEAFMDYLIACEEGASKTDSKKKKLPAPPTMAERDPLQPDTMTVLDHTVAFGSGFLCSTISGADIDYNAVRIVQWVSNTYAAEEEEWDFSGVSAILKKFPNLEELVFDFGCNSVRNFSLSGLKNVEILKLRGAHEDFDQFSLTLPALKELYMEFCSPPAAQFAESLANCPQLAHFQSYKFWPEQELPTLYLPNCVSFVMTRSDCVDSVRIHAPRLQELVLQNMWDLEEVKLVDQPHPKAKSLKHGELPKEPAPMMVDLTGTLPEPEQLGEMKAWEREFANAEHLGLGVEDGAIVLDTGKVKAPEKTKKGSAASAKKTAPKEAEEEDEDLLEIFGHTETMRQSVVNLMMHPRVACIQPVARCFREQMVDQLVSEGVPRDMALQMLLEEVVHAENAIAEEKSSSSTDGTSKTGAAKTKSRKTTSSSGVAKSMKAVKKGGKKTGGKK